MVREAPSELPWLIETLVIQGGLTILTGEPGQGKSLLSQALAVGVGTGEVEAGMRCRRGKALILDAENGEHEIHRRIHALRPPPGAVSIVEAEGFDLRYDLGHVADLVAAHRPTLLILDSFRSMWTGDENDPGEVTQALAPLQMLLRHAGIGGLLLHHVGKKQESTYRGSSAIAATCELIFQLGRNPADQDQERRFLRCVKSRPAAEPSPRWLRLSTEREQVLISEASAPDATTGRGPGRPGTAERFTPVILEKLREGPQTQADLARAIGQDPSSGTVRKLLHKLREDQQVEREGEHGKWCLAEIASPQGNGNFGNLTNGAVRK